MEQLAWGENESIFLPKTGTLTLIVVVVSIVVTIGIIIITESRFTRTLDTPSTGG